MSATKIAITIDEQLLDDIDHWVASGEFPSRSRAIQEAVRSFQKSRGRRQRLLSELAKLDPEEERSLANERFQADVF